MAEATGNDPGDRNLDHLEKQSERTRAALAQTLNELQGRFSMDVVTSNARKRVAETGQSLIRDNPLRTVAIGAALAYPVWRIARTLPVPLLLLGAGVALSGRGGSPKSGERTGGARMRPAAFGGRSEAGSSVDVASGGSRLETAASSLSASLAESFEGRLGAVVGTVQEAASAAVERARDAAVRAKELGGETIGTAKGVVSTASGWSSEAYGRGVEATAHVGHRASDLSRSGRDALVEAVERNPVLVGGVTAVLGAALAAAIPTSRTEARYLGEASDDVKDQARALVSRGLNVASASAERIFQATLDEAEEQGLTARAAEEAARELSEKARAVAARAEAAAFEGEDVPTDPGRASTTEHQ